MNLSVSSPYQTLLQDLLLTDQPNRTARLEARIAPDALAVVKRAAPLQGRSLSEFVVSGAQEAAHRAIEEAEIIRLSLDDQMAFVEAILNPPPVSPALERAAASHRDLIASSP